MYFTNIGKINVDVNGDGIVDILSNLTSAVKFKGTAIDNMGFYKTVEVFDGERPDQLSERLYGSPTYHWTFLLLNSHIKNVWDDWPMQYSQLLEYCENKYDYLGAVTNDNLDGKFVVGETITGVLSGATGTIKEIHVNNSYLVIEQTSTTNFTSVGESLIGSTSTDTMIASGIKSAAHAYHHHVDDTTGRTVPKRSSGTSPVTFLEFETDIHDNNKNMKVVKPEHIREISKKFIQLMG